MLSKLFEKLYKHDAPRPVHQRIVQVTVRIFCRTLFLLMYRHRVHGLKNFPKERGIMICPNHQSNLDPILVGVSLPQFPNYLGKKTLFKFPPMGWLLRKLDTIPIDRQATGIAGMKETLRRLKRKESVVIFPEGQRSFDGELQELMTGFIALVKRTKVPMLPVGIDGAHQSWPRGQAIPRPGIVDVVIGKPIYKEEYEHLTEAEMVQLLHDRMRECFEEARTRRAERLNAPWAEPTHS